LAGSLTVAFGQSSTGQISGTLVDTTDKSIAGATITVTSELTGQAREVTTTSDGAFVVPNLVAGNYTLQAASPGFKTYTQKNIPVTTAERVSVHTITMQVGDVSTSLTVAAEIVHIQTDSSDRVAKVSEQVIEDIPLTINHQGGYLDVLKTVPGVVNGAVNGGRSGQTMITIDGISGANTGAQGNGISSPQGIGPNLDTIGEITVALNSYQAEYGQRAGGTIAVTTKSGTKAYHGTLYYYGRHEKLNANSYANNANRANLQADGTAGRPRYRFENPGYTIGGPLLIPGVAFNKKRDKLFFFWSQDKLIQIQTVSTNRIMVPTQAQLAGDFSQTFAATTGTLVPLYQPANGTTINVQYPGNLLPASLNGLLAGTTQKYNGLAQMLKLYPLPNAGFTTNPAYPGQGNDPTNTYNYQFFNQAHTPSDENILRIDYNLNPKTLMYFRMIQTYNGTETGITNATWPNYTSDNATQSLGNSLTVVRTIKPNLINETVIGYRTAREYLYYDQSELNKLTKTAGTAGVINMPQFNASLNPDNLVPGLAGAGPGITWDQRFPFRARDTIENLSNNISWVKGQHNTKFGFLIEHVIRNAPRESQFQGNYNVAPAGQSLDPVDSNIGIANALMQHFTTYAESDARLKSYARYTDISWFAQDNWKVNRKLTLDLGIRFQRVQPSWGSGNKLANFEPSAYNPAQSPVLVRWACPAGGNYCGSGAARPYNPITGAYMVNNAAFVATFATDASGNIVGSTAPGMVIYNEHLIPSRLGIGPSVGFAYDVLGNGKMALRGGFGIRYDRPGGDDFTLQHAAMPPLENTPTYYYGQVDSLFSGALHGVLSPASGIFAPQSEELNYKLPATYNWSFGVQKDLTHGVVLDVSYAGNVGRHQRESQSLESAPYGTLRQQSACDPARSASAAATPVLALGQSTAASVTCTLLSNQFLVPIPAYGGLNYNHYDATSNYHSLQVQLNRRFSRRLQAGGFWVWSKAMDYNGGTLPLYIDPKLVYGVGSADRTHNLTANWTYTVPSVSSFLGKNFLTKQIDGWKLSGFGTWTSGSPATVTFSQFINGTSGSTVDFAACINCGAISRVNLTGPIQATSDKLTSLAAGSSTGQVFATQSGLDISAFAPATIASNGFGNTGRVTFRNPGLAQVDLALSKTFRVDKNEAHELEFKLEAFNAFNHTNPGAVNAAAQFDSTGKLINGYNNGAGGTFGTYALSAGSAGSGFNRIGIFSLRFRF
jgi:hypothetical protein